MNSQKKLHPSLQTFILNEKSFFYRDVLEGNIDLEDASAFEIETLTFIKNWLSGQTNFQLKTSGSTGKPKIVNVTKDQMQKSAIRTITEFDLRPEQIILACLNTAFVAGMMMLVRAIEGKFRLIIVSPTANPLAHIDHGKTIHFCALTPYQAKTIIDENPEKLTQIEKLLIGGAALSPTLDKSLQDIEANVFHSYAMTETLTHVALRNVNGIEKSDVYYALDGVSFSQDERACLIIHDQILGIDSLITNDIVELIDEKSFRWTGRFDHVINSGGIKIQLEEVENKIEEILKGHGISRPFCLISIPDDKLTNKLILLIEHYENKLNERTILRELKSKLPKYHNPKIVKQIPTLNRTESGKIDRAMITEMYLNN